MDKSPHPLHKKQYFTQSRPNLTHNHSTQEFMSIIQLKKHYQSLIKQELNALTSIENAQQAQLSRWQPQKQVKVSLFQAKQQEQLKCQQKVQVEKSSEQFVECYDALRVIKMQKQFVRLKQKLRMARQIGIKKRAAIYFSSQNVSQRWFSSWKQSSKQALSQAKITKAKQVQLLSTLRHAHSKQFIAQLLFLTKKKQMRAVFNVGSKKKFLNRLCNAASMLFIKMRQQQALRQFKKRQAWSTLKQYLQYRRAITQIRLKSKLLNNIFCHRKFNIFFTACKQQKFKQQQTQITGEIINKVDILALITHSSQISQPNYEETSPQHPPTDAKTKPMLNIPLLNLILQNFVDEYSQQFSSCFSQQQRVVLLVELRSLIVAQLRIKQKCRFLMGQLRIQRSSKQFQAYLRSGGMCSTVYQLRKMRHMSKCRREVLQLITKPRQELFIQVMRMRYDTRGKQTRLCSSKIGWRWQIQRCITHWKQYRLNSQVARLNKQMAINWRNMFQYKLYFSSWTQYIKLEAQAQVVPFDITDNHIQSTRKQQQLRTDPAQPNDNHSQGQPQRTQKVTKAKLQLSKIVSAISKNMMASKYSLDSYSKSIESHDSQKFHTQLRMKTESAHHLDYDYQYQPRPVDLQLHKKQSIEQELQRQLQRKSAKLCSQVQLSRAVSSLQFMRQQYAHESKLRKVVASIRHKITTSLFGSYKYQLAIVQQSHEMATHRKRVAIMHFKANTKQLKILRGQRQTKIHGLNKFIMRQAKMRVGIAISQAISRIRQNNQLQQLQYRILLRRARQSLRTSCDNAAVRNATREVHKARLRRLLQELILLMQTQAQQQVRQSQSNRSRNNDQQECNRLGNYFSESEHSADEPAVAHGSAQSGQEQQQQYHQGQQHDQEKSQHQDQQEEQLQSHSDQSQQDTYYVDNFSQLQQYTPNTPITQHNSKSHIPATQAATLSNQIHNHLQQEASQQLLWLQQQLNNQSHSINREHFPRTQQQQPLSLDDSIEEEQTRLVQCSHMILRSNLLQLLQAHRSSQQIEIELQQQREIVRYQLHKHNGRLKQNAFNTLLALVQLKKHTDLMVRSWKAWTMLAQQKRTLRQYLQLQNRAQQQPMSYYPTTIAQKQLFQYLKQP